MTTTPSMTPKRLRVLTYIVERRRETGLSPTYQEIANHFGHSKTTILESIVALEKMGVVTREHGGKGGGASRGIRLVNGDECCPMCGQGITKGHES